MLQNRMRRGEMDRKITFVKKVIGTNSFNEDKEISWQAVPVNPIVWARMRQSKGTEVVIADRINYAQVTTFTCDYRDDVTEIDFRVVFNTRMYNILSITPNEASRGMYIDVVCTIVDTETWT